MDIKKKNYPEKTKKYQKNQNNNYSKTIKILCKVIQKILIIKKAKKEN